jgi:AraC-like DNA-binding protein
MNLFFRLIILSLSVSALQSKVVFHSDFEVGHTVLQNGLKSGDNQIILMHTPEFDSWPAQKGQGILFSYQNNLKEAFLFAKRSGNILKNVTGIKKAWEKHTLVYFGAFYEWDDFHRQKVLLRQEVLNKDYFAEIHFDTSSNFIFLRKDFEPLDEYYCRYYIKFSDAVINSRPKRGYTWYHDVVSAKTGTMRMGLILVGEKKLPCFCLRFHTGEGSKNNVYVKDSIPVNPNIFYCVEYHFIGGKEKTGGAEFWVNNRHITSKWDHNTGFQTKSSRIFFGATSWAMFKDGYMGLDNVAVSTKRIGPVMHKPLETQPEFNKSGVAKVHARIVEERGNRPVEDILRGKWYRLVLQFDNNDQFLKTKKIRINLTYLLEHFGSPSDREAAPKQIYFWEANLRNKTLWTDFAPGTEIPLEVTNQKHDYIDDSQGQYRISEDEKSVQMVFRVLENASVGPWFLSVDCMDDDNQKQISSQNIINVVQTEAKKTKGYLFVIAIILGLSVVLIEVLRRKKIKLRGKVEPEKDPVQALKKEIKQIIESNYQDQDFSSKSLAGQLNWSPVELSRKFKMIMGTTFPDYINTLRIGKAKKLLKETDKKIFEIAYEVGYNNIEHFNSMFKRYEKISPTYFREKQGI